MKTWAIQWKNDLGKWQYLIKGFLGNDNQITNGSQRQMQAEARIMRENGYSPRVVSVELPPLPGAKARNQ